MASEVFSLVYDGDAIQDGEMSVAELGPALVAMGELFTTANAMFNGNEATVSTNVKADFKEGSFEILFHIHQALTDPTSVALPGVFLLGTDPLISQVIGKVIDKAKDKVVDGAIDGLFKLLETLKGKKAEKVENDESRKVSVLVYGDNNKITVTQDTVKLYENPRARTLAAQVGSPLKRKGYAKMSVKRDAEVIAELEPKDFPEVVEVPLLPETTTGTGDGPQQMIVEILKPTFVEGKWSVSDGSKRFQVDMEDEAFKGRVHAREVGFYDGDLYRVEMLTSQHMKKGKLTTERKITRVIEPVSEAVQESLELPAPSANRGGRKFKDIS